MNFISESVGGAGDKGNKITFSERKINCSAHTEAECGIFCEMSNLSQYVVRDNIADVFDNNAEKSLADLLRLLACFSGKSENNIHYHGAEKPEKYCAEYPYFLHELCSPEIRHTLSKAGEK